MSIPPEDIQVLIGKPQHLGDSLLKQAKEKVAPLKDSKILSERRAWLSYKYGTNDVVNPMAIMTQKSTGDILGVARLIEKKTIITLNQSGIIGNMSQGNPTFMRAIAMHCKNEGKALHVTSSAEVGNYCTALGMTHKPGSLVYSFTKSQTAAWASSNPEFSGMSVVKLVPKNTVVHVPTPVKAPKKIPTPKPLPVAEEAIPKPMAVQAGDWEAIPNTQFGSNPGGLYTGPDGKAYYLKFYKDVEQTYSEVAADKIAQKMGLETLHAQIIEVDGKKAVATLWKSDGEQLKKLISFKDVTALQKEDLAKQYLHASLTGNWDVVGADYDNLVRFPDGRWLCVDHGGTFKFRAQGGDKLWGTKVDEIESLLAPGRKSGEIFNKILASTIEANPEKYISMLESMSGAEGSIYDMFVSVGWGKLRAAEMQEVLLARRRKLVEHLEKFITKPSLEKRRSIKVAFQKAEDNVYYKEMVKKWGKIYDDEVSKLKNVTPEETQRVFRHAFEDAAKRDKGLRKVLLDTEFWSGNSTSPQANALRLKATQMEATPLKMIWKSYLDKSMVEELAGELSDEAYIEARAISQVYFKKNKIKSLKLYRGFGGRTGTEYADAVKKVIEHFPKDYKKRTANIFESGLSGWSTRKKTAITFGGRFVITENKPVSEIVFWDSLWPRGLHLLEKESICLGFNGDPVPLGHMLLS